MVMLDSWRVTRKVQQMKSTFLSAILLWVTLVITGCSRSDNTLVIGMDASYPPFEYKDSSGQFAGVSVDMGNALAKDLGKDVQFQNIGFDGLIAALKSGSVDVVISSMTANDVRRQSIDFSEPYVKIGLALLLAKNSPVQSIDDLNKPGRKVAVRLGTTAEAYAREHLPEVQRVVLDSDTACVMEVVKGGVDAWIYDQLSLLRYHERHPETTRLLLNPVRSEFWAIGLRKGDAELKAKVDDFLKRYRAEGAFQKLAEKHLAKERQMMTEAGVPFLFEVGQ